MANLHVGQRWPVVYGRDWHINTMANDGGYYIPRRMRMRNTLVPQGVLALPWLELEFNSEVYVVATDRQSISWDFLHPDDSLDLVRMILTWFEQNTTEGGQFHRNIFWRMTIAYINHGTTYASGHTLDSGDSQYFRGDYAASFWKRGQPPLLNPWHGSIGSPLFTNMGRTEFRCSLWDEQPDWHPYRYGP